MRSGGEYTKDLQLKRLTSIAEIIKRIFFDNRYIANNWYDGEVSSVEYERDEEDQSISRAIISFQCNVNEVIS
jgi:hypothetical protein